MKRRTYLASVTSVATLTAWSGCMSSAASRTATDRMKKTVTVSDIAQPPELEFDVNLVDTEITSNSTARIALRYTNPSEQDIEVNLNPEHPAPLHSVETDPGLVLLSDAYDPTRKGTTCWKPTQDGFPQAAVAYQHPIEPGKDITLEYDVWAAPQQDSDCINPAEYRFEPLYGSFVLTVSTTDPDT